MPRPHERLISDAPRFDDRALGQGVAVAAGALPLNSHFRGLAGAVVEDAER